MLGNLIVLLFWATFWMALATVACLFMRICKKPASAPKRGL